MLKSLHNDKNLRRKLKINKHRILILTLISIILLICISTVNANEWYISQNTNTTGDGSINHPFKSLNEGLDISNHGDTIYLKNGTYILNNYKINKTIKIIGENKDKTIISGNNTTRIFKIENGNLSLINLTLTNANLIPQQESGGVAYIETGTINIENTIIKDNLARYGAGIYNYDGTIKINNTIFTNQYSLTYSGCDGGSCIYNLYGNTYIYNTIFENNTVIDQQAAGIYTNKGILIVNNCTFINNTATITGCGGAIYCNDFSKTNITNSYFKENSGWLGGAIYTANGLNRLTGYTNIINCQFHNNTARKDGGAIYNYWEISTLKLENNTFTGNKARSGGTIYNQLANLTLINNTITNSNASVEGYQIYNNGLIEEVTITIENNQTIPIQINKTQEITITITNNNAKITNGDLNIYANNKLIKTQRVKEGIVKFNYTINTTETLISANYTKSLKSNVKTALLLTKKIETQINSTNMEKNYRNNEKYTAQLTDTNKNPISNQTLYLNLTRKTNKQSKVYQITTNENGYANLEINLAPGEYTIKIEYPGDEKYENTEKENTISITDNMTPIITANNYTNLEGKTGNFKGSSNLKNQKVEIKITRLSNNLSKTYTVTTNSLGEYDLPINLAKGDYKVFCSFDKAELYHPVSAEASIKIL